MSIEVARLYGIRAQLDIMQEECAELIQACSKYNRSRGYGYRTNRTVKETTDELIEEMAQVQGCIKDVMELLDIPQSLMDEVSEKANKKAYELSKATKEENPKYGLSCREE